MKQLHEFSGKPLTLSSGNTVICPGVRGGVLIHQRGHRFQLALSNFPPQLSFPVRDDTLGRAGTDNAKMHE